MITFAILAAIFAMGAGNAAAQRFSTHPGVETWPR
jgi:hypothetical protein